VARGLPDFQSPAGLASAQLDSLARLSQKIKNRSSRHPRRQPRKPCRFGADQAAVCEQSIAQGWQGLSHSTQQRRKHDGRNSNADLASFRRRDEEIPHVSR